MAYNRPYDPDALPRFAEPEPKHGAAPPPSASHAQPSPRYDSKPPAPAPRDHYKQPTYGHASPPPMPPQPQQQQQHPQHPSYSQGQPPRTSSHHAPPPPQSSTTQQARPQQPHPQHSRPPPSPVPDPSSGSDATLLPLFRAVDKDGTGQLSEKELSAALVNGDWTAFDIQTVRMMIRMFDSDRNGTINFEEFCGLWSFLASWRTLFDRFDVDRSGNISLSEFTDALIAFRYRLSPSFVELLFRTYDKRGEGVMSFDLFVQSCISLKRMTDVFKKYDDDRDGFITLSFEDFLSEILKQLK
ncbi:peflin [Purpureocillium lavendulum]|uniref:Peflin n=1 Tax=Purpureocillium lavendulum TaxID=1247861 RepID=A0AB34G399_9HYPO|nr:peflin [Purpureocillium lavendulum]